jgi:hypothetical protein
MRLLDSPAHTPPSGDLETLRCLSKDRTRKHSSSTSRSNCFTIRCLLKALDVAHQRVVLAKQKAPSRWRGYSVVTLQDQGPPQEASCTVGLVCRPSSPDRRRISLRRWVRLIPGILNAKAAIACAGRLTLLEAREAAILTAAAAASATVIGAPRIEDHRRARLRTRRQRDCDRSGQQQSEFGRHCHSPSDRRLLLRRQMAIERVRKKPGSLHMRTQRRDISLLCLCTQDPAKTHQRASLSQRGTLY